MNITRFLAILLAGLFFTVAAPGGPAFAQDEARAAAEAAQKKQQTRFDALKAILKSQAERRTAIEALNEQLKVAGDGEKEALETKSKKLQAEVEQLERQFEALATGGAASKFVTNEGKEIDIRQEFEQLLEPLIIMLKMATEDSRQIEMLRHGRLLASSQLRAAQSALEGVQDAVGQTKDEVLLPRLGELETLWKKRTREAKDLVVSIDSQLEARLRSKEAAGGAGQAFTKFIRDRGINIMLGISGFALVIILMQLAKRFIGGRLNRYVTRDRSFRLRLIGLFYQIATLGIAIGLTIYLFNLRNDWLLMALAIIFLLAAGWVFIKMLPNLVEQVTILLNLGAAQENERVVFKGVPWRITDLGFYTTLENPLLRGGSITMPVRELIGLHSRPIAKDEPWFPCREGDWVVLSDGHRGEVIMQSPEMVQIRLLGGATVSYTTETFLGQNPTNLSNNFRVEIEFGIDYQHQAIATSVVPETFQEVLKKGLGELLGGDDLLGVKVEFKQAGSSSLDFEIEADIAGRAARRYEDVEHAMSRILVDACNDQKWIIPFPQLTLHKAE